MPFIDVNDKLLVVELTGEGTWKVFQQPVRTGYKITFCLMIGLYIYQKEQMGLLSFLGIGKKKLAFGAPDEPRWQGRVGNKEKLTENDAKFLFDQSEKFLKDSVENSNLIVIVLAH